MTELLLIDLSSIAHPLWAIHGAESDPNTVSTKTVARVRALASAHPHAAVCCDSGKSFRAEIDPTYKATRGERPAALYHQIDLAIETLKGDGFPVWQCKGFEADDALAGACFQALQRDDCTVLIASSDKDLLALVGPRVSVKSLTSGNTIDEAGVFEKFGVKPEQMTDYLCLVGDASDNIKGAKGIGPKKAAELLGLYISLDFLYAALDDKTAILTPAVLASLVEFRERLPVVRQLVTMKTDAPIPFEDIFKERTPTDAGDFNQEGSMSADMFPPQTYELPRPSTSAGDPPQPTTSAAGDHAEIWRPDVTPVVVTPAGHDTEAQALQQWTQAPAQFSMQLEPRGMGEATKLAEWAFRSRLFSSYGTAEGVLCALLAGREHGLQAMASLRAFHIIEGKLSASADFMVALVLRSGLAEYFRPVSFDAKQATFETLRKGNGNKPIQFQYTIEMAMLAGLVKPKSGWERNPLNMNISRAKSNLARLAYPDVLMGMLSVEEAVESVE